MAWIYLLVAGGFEVFGVSMIHSLNKARNWRSIGMISLGFGGSFLFLTLAMQTLPMSTAYALWTGIGASGGAVLGMLRYGEARDLRRILYIVMILGAAVGLKLVA
ncbi:DMT family transporter [Paenibacillus donghaensis]|uniref:QacE family quaternary ammonium compound efflux SMR transporter n=1 Tax=Paenibacillus donghaensis TaxID=414771 RepID=A0A2Z2K5N4_9BACL|nr:multidrug efflux SMR transporter [Paenibacillus donghaensis]ASA19894.1 QacE family quaternary ammonium compound efflux SMR transporter [Paenibacillus donghaensis]